MWSKDVTISPGRYLKTVQHVAKEKNNDLLTPRLGVNFHGMNMFLPTNGLKLKLSNLLFRPFVKFNMNCADHIFSYGSKVTSTINKRNIPFEKIIEIPTGIEKEYTVDPDKIKLNKKLKFLFVGRDDPLKGVNEIFKALQKIDISLLDFEFIGPIPEKIHQKNIIYHGLVQNKQQIFKIMDDCDVLVLPSYSEGMPNVILEAMARGLIILATDVGAVNLLVSKNNGVLIESPDSRNIITAIETILYTNNLSLLKMKKHSVKVIVNSFTWEKVVNLTIEKISSLTKI
jgi:glycosyltransferase involved in cell wall biosynthesis